MKVKSSILAETDIGEHVKSEENSVNDIPTCEKIIEAVLFAAGHPVDYSKLSETLGISIGLCKRIVSDYAKRYNSNDTISRGIMLVMFPESCQLCTKEEYGHYIKKALGIKKGGNLSGSSLEVLAIIAYNQPVTRAFVDTVRGVDSSYTISSMCDKKLIESCGKLDVPGHPLLYRTTDNFLRVFGLNSLADLPPVSTDNNEKPFSEDTEQINISEI